MGNDRVPLTHSIKHRFSFFNVESTIIYVNFSMLKCLARKTCFTLAPLIAQAASDWLVLIDDVFILVLQFFLFILLGASCTLVKV